MRVSMEKIDKDENLETQTPVSYEGYYRNFLNITNFLLLQFSP